MAITFYSTPAMYKQPFSYTIWLVFYSLYCSHPRGKIMEFPYSFDFHAPIYLLHFHVIIIDILMKQSSKILSTFVRYLSSYRSMRTLKNAHFPGICEVFILMMFLPKLWLESFSVLFIICCSHSFFVSIFLFFTFQCQKVL